MCGGFPTFDDANLASLDLYMYILIYSTTIIPRVSLCEVTQDFYYGQVLSDLHLHMILPAL